MTSQSPPSRHKAFQWPIPNKSPITKNNNNNNEISVREIIEKYYPNDKELLKHALMAKAEEDKKQTAQDTLKTEQARIHLRHLDLELMREQTKVTVQPQYYSLAPVQQQVLARITGHPNHISPSNNNNNNQQPPASPGVYPHSAHPLCLPDNRLNPPRQYLQLPTSQQPTTPVSPSHEYDLLRKRGRASISYTAVVEEDKHKHNKVMEALKAKIQRGSSSPLATTAPNSAFRDNNKRQRTLPKPTASEPPPINTTTTLHQLQPSTPSPRSAKPILPPIDTSIGRIPTTTLPSHPLMSPIKSSTSPHPSH
ncbi:hypothetical protein HPULCUR_005307 [Helicostylum pulchrum]|uniref:Uncharacterized protein n=1 Tax=Helicostylum pulchrum TaxID=562976 RepID=A0ABP9XYT4_9FUNG